MVDAFTRPDYAGFVRRVVAWLLDLVVFSVAWFVLLVVLTLANGGELDLEGAAAFAVFVAPAMAWKTLWIASPLRGTPGHRFVGIRVVRPDGSRVTLARAAGRTAAAWATYAFFVVGVVLSAVAVLASARRQAIHDMVAGTVCVERDALVRIGSPQHVPTPSQLEAPTAASAAEPVFEQRPVSTEERHRGPFL